MPSAIEQIVIYGVANPQRLKLTQILQNKIPVSTLQFYCNPTAHPDKHLQKIDFQMWAYPDGIKLYHNNLILNDNQPQFSFFAPEDLLDCSPNRNNPPQYIYSFVLTDYDLNRTYCTCLIWNQRYYIKDDRNQIFSNPQLSKSLDERINEELKSLLFTKKQHHSMAIPKCKVETMVNNPLVLDTNNILVFVPRAMIICSKTSCLQFQRSLLKYYYNNVLMQAKGKQIKTINIPRIIENQFQQLIKNQGYSKGQAKFDKSKSETLQKIQIKLLKNSFHNYEKDKSWGMLSVQTNKLKDFFISSMFTIPQNPKNSFILTESGTQIASKLFTDTVFHIPKFIDLFSQHFLSSSTPPLLPLPISQFIQLWKCLLLQKQIIIFTNSQYKSLQLSQLMLHLIQPIKWENIYIPFLPFHLAHHIDAIGGYLIGMSRIHMDYMLERFQMKTKVVVDLQHKTILQQGGKQVIQLPEQIRQFLQSSLKRIINAYEESCKPTHKNLINYFITNSQAANQKQKPKQMQNFIASWLQIQKVFFHALVALFNNFIPFIVKKDDGIISVRTQAYLSILKDSLHRQFMKEISKTMVFIRLCQYHSQQSERCAWVQKTLGQLFVYSHDILSHKFIKGNQQSYIQSQKYVQAWKITDLLETGSKYNKYIQYLFDKNLKQILHVAISTQLYLIQEQKKYKILTSQDQFQSFNSLQNIQVPANFGEKHRKPNKRGEKTEKGDMQQDEKYIYELIIHSQEVMKSKKYKKYGQKDEQDLYQQFFQVCQEHKIDKYLVKYLKYLQQNSPETLRKFNDKPKKKLKNESSLVTWLWDLINPPDASKQKQEAETKIKLQRKMTMKQIKINILDLKSLFGPTKMQIQQGSSISSQDQTQKLRVKLKQKEKQSAKEVIKKQQKELMKQKIGKFKQKIREKGQTISHRYSQILITQDKSLL